jgi:hypothetical protein
MDRPTSSKLDFGLLRPSVSAVPGLQPQTEQEFSRFGVGWGFASGDKTVYTKTAVVARCLHHPQFLRASLLPGLARFISDPSVEI